MTDLRQTQTALQRFILAQDDAIRSIVTGDERLSAGQRLGIYAYAYESRLIESLQQTYPALAQVMGDERFVDTARAFVHQHPSRVASIRYFGRGLAEFLDVRATEPAGAMLADLARWEWTLSAAFDGPDASALPDTALGGVPADRWPGVCLRMPGSLQRVSLQTNAVEWWRFAIQDAAQPAAPVMTARTEWVVWRTGLATSFRSLPIDEARMLDAALRGAPFGDLCAGLVEFGEDDNSALRAATLLKTWWAAGWVVGLDFVA
jgi:hypothetical protein